MTSKTKAAAVGVGLLVLLGSTPAAAQQTVEGPRFRANVAEIEIGGRVQTQFNTTTADDEPTGEFLLRRVRLEAKVKVNDLVSGKIQPDFAGDRFSLKDAYLKLTFAPGLQVLAGKAHRPFGLLEQTSSTRMMPIERGARIRGVAALDEYELVNSLRYSDRDIGVQLMGEPEGAPLGFAYAAGVFGGPLQGRVGEEDGYQFAARAAIRPTEQLTLGAGVSNRAFGRSLGELGYEMERGTALEIDLEYGRFDPGFHVLGELSYGDFDPFLGDSFLGAQAWLGYRTQPLGPVVAGLEPAFRISYGAVDSALPAVDALGGTLWTPGLSVWFGGLNRLQVNYDVWTPALDAADAQGSFKAQMQMAF